MAGLIIGSMFIAIMGLIMVTLDVGASYLQGERVEISCDDGECTLLRGGAGGRMHPVGAFPEAAVYSIDSNCAVKTTVDVYGGTDYHWDCRPVLWLSDWSGPLIELNRKQQSFDAPPPYRPDGAVYVPLTTRAHKNWRAAALARGVGENAGGTWRVQDDTHDIVPYRYLPLVLVVEAVIVPVLAMLSYLGLRRIDWSETGV